MIKASIFNKLTSHSVFMFLMLNMKKIKREFGTTIDCEPLSTADIVFDRWSGGL